MALEYPRVVTRRQASRADRLRSQVVIVFAAIVALALMLSVLTSLHGRSVNLTTTGFVDHDLPSVAILFDLKLAVVSEEPILYDYYATGDRARFRASHGANARRIEKILAQLKQSSVAPDLVRGIFPSVKTITRSGFGEVPEDEVRRLCEAILAERSSTGNGA